jgi:hypothetical protein
LYEKDEDDSEEEEDDKKKNEFDEWNEVTDKKRGKNVKT